MLEKLNTWMVNLTLLAFPSLTLFVKPAASQILGFSILWAVILLLTTAPVRKISPSEKIISRVFLLFILVAIASFVLKGVNYQGFKELGRYARFFAYLPLLVVFFRSQSSVSYLVGGFIIGSVLSGGWALYASSILEYERIKGDVNTILYANFSLVYASSVLLIALHFCCYKKFILAFFLTIASFLGIFGTVMSGARGAIIALPLVFFGALLLIVQRFNLISFKMLIICSLFSSFIICASLLSLNDMAKKRLIGAAEEIGYYTPGRHSGNHYTSVGLRFDMWIMSVKAWADNPLLGVGQGHYIEYAKKEAATNGGYHSFLITERYTQSHNEYLFVAASRGALGVASLLLTFFVPMWIFSLKIFRKIKSGKNDQIYSALIGTTMISMYMVYCLTESMFARSQAVSLYVFYIAACSYFSFSGDKKTQ